MVPFKNILVGFLVSFIGSVPLGFLNVVGYQLYAQHGICPTVCFLLGVVAVEFFVVYFTLVFADRLAANRRLSKAIEGFSVVFMFVLAYVFYASAGNANLKGNALPDPHLGAVFLKGLLLSALNFVQLPFWTGWNLYLLNGSYIQTDSAKKYFYIFGTLVGTFAGMLTLIVSLDYFAAQAVFLEKYLMKAIIPLVFVALGIFQGFKFFSQYRK